MLGLWGGGGQGEYPLCASWYVAATKPDLVRTYARTAQLTWVLKMSDIPLFGIAQVGPLLVAMAPQCTRFYVLKRINLAHCCPQKKCYFSGEK